jgi:membrane-bound lytic murein transglycosylase A
LGLRRIAFSDIGGWTGDRLDGVLPVLLAECERLGRLPVDTRLGGQGEAGSAAGRAGLYQPACRAARALPLRDEATLRHYLETWFLPYEASDGSTTDASFTGYFEPEFAGSLAPSASYPVPVYGRPQELVTAPGPQNGSAPVTGRVQNGQVVPYYSRAQIDAGALVGRNLEILWLHDPVDLFFLQVQGSGRVRLPTGQIVRLGYAGRNGQPYVPLGRLLIERKQLAAGDVSMQSIRFWLAAHPGEARSLMEQNPNYVFFRPLDDVAPNQGPPGALGLSLTPLRSAAVDRAFLPLGVPLFVSTTRPDGAPLDRLVLAQDLGTDITGPIRADLFFGWGASAARDAGAMHAGGRIVVLLPRQPGGP